MRIGIATVGTRGEIEPYVALAHALTKAGHKVAFTAPRNAARLAAGIDARFLPMNLDVHAVFDSDEGGRWLADGCPDAFMAGISRMLSAARVTIAESLIAVSDHCDVLVTAINTEDYGHAVAEARGIPMVPVHLVPWLPTCEYPQPLTWQDVPQDEPGAAEWNWATFQIAEGIYWQGKKDDVNAFRRSLGLRQATCSLLGWMPTTGLPVLQAFSSHIVPRPADWSEQSVITGFWRLPGEARRRVGESDLPAGLQDWLEAGPPPIFIGFGTPVLNPERVISLVTQAARLTGLRIIIGAGRSNLSGLSLAMPDTVRLTGVIDHDWLFPRCRAVIHHGGTGTTAAGLTAGCPTWIFSVFGTQPFWGNRVTRLGVGGCSRFVDLDLSHLIMALRELTRDDVLRRAAVLGEKVRAEGGVAGAVPVIEKIAD